MAPNVLFINPPSIPFSEIIDSMTGENLIGQPVAMPMGLIYISSYIKKYSAVDQVGILDYTVNLHQIANYNTVEQFINGIARRDAVFTPDILAFSLIFSTAHPFVLMCIEVLKSIWPSTTVIVGGTHATNCTAHLLENEFVDYVIRGEGEVALAEYIRQYSFGESIRVKGLYSQQGLEPIPDLALSETENNLDNMPFPDWELINMEAYIQSKGRKRDLAGAKEARGATIVTSRGCPFHCTFCSAHTVHGRKMRFRSAANVVEEVKLLYSHYGITTFIAEDDLFTANKDRLLEMLTGMKDLRIPDFKLQLPNALSVNTLDTECLEALISAGMSIATLAIESGSKYVQKHVIKKNCNLDKAIDIAKFLKDKGIMVRCYYILGFPSETKEQMMETIDYARSLGADWSAFNLATPLIGTEMFSQFVDMGCIKDDINSWANTIYQERYFDTSEISAHELNDLAYLANLECNFFNNINKTFGNYEKAIEIFYDILSSHPFHIVAWYCIMECYSALGDDQAAKRAGEQIKTLVNNDKRSAEMFNKYMDMMPLIQGIA